MAGIFDGKQLKDMRWKDPAPAGKPSPEQRAARSARDALRGAIDGLIGNGVGGELDALSGFTTADQFRKQDEEEAAAAKALADQKAAYASAKTEATESTAKLRAAEKAVRDAERAKRERLATEYATRLEERMRTIEAVRAQNGKRPLDQAELRARAANALAKDARATDKETP